MDFPAIQNSGRYSTNSGSSELSIVPAQDNKRKDIKIVSIEQKPVVDLWPAYASGNIVGPQHLALAKSVIPPKLITLESTRTQIESKRKPRFLQELENFVVRELKATANVKDDRARELKLQVYREVFDVLIEDFRAYRGLLAAIKNEYELMIAHLRQKIRDLEPLQQSLTTQAAQFEQKVLEIEQAENEEIEHMKIENRKLRQRIANFRQDELAWQEQIKKLQEDLAVQYQCYRDECDARKLLIADINDLRYQQEEAQQAALLATKNKGEGIEDDSELMKIALKEAKKAEAEATAKLGRMEADYADVVPRRDFEILEKEHENLKEQFENISRDFTSLHSDHKQLQETYKELKTSSTTLAKEYEEHKGMSTPRPKWDKASSAIYGGSARWEKLSEGKGSDQLLDVLLDELRKIGGIADESTPAYFNGLGTEPNVPVYLQCQGKIRNRRLGRRDLLFEINNIWTERTESRPESRSTVSMENFFMKYLRKHNMSETMVYEWAYNIHMACQRNHDDDRVRLFFSILTGQMDEELYHYQQTVFKKITAKLETADSASEGALSPDVLRFSLAEIFPDKTDQRLDNLVRYAKLQVDWQDGEQIAYRVLLGIDDEGGVGVFLDEVKDQLMAERQEFIDAIIQNTNGRALIEPSLLIEAMRAADPLITDNHVTRYACWAFSSKEEDLDNCPALSNSDIRDRLLSGCIYKVGRSIATS